MTDSLSSDQHADVSVAKPPVVAGASEQEPVQILEHYHRYLYASRFTKNKRVLVCGAGEGYGAAFVSLNAGSVLAIDENAERSGAAARKYAEHPNLRFQAGDVADLAFLEHSIDVAVIFDQINTCAPESRTRLIESVKRVLDPSGVLLISTPIRSGDARTETGEGAGPLPAFSGVEFFEFLKQHFQHVRFMAQKPLTFSTMWSLHEWTDDFFRFHAREDLFTLPRNLEMFSEPAVIVALCSDDDIPIDITNNSKSVYFDTVHAEQAKRIIAEMEELRADIIRARTLIMRVTGERDAFRDAIMVLTNENLTHLNALDGMQRDLDDRAARIADLEAAVAQETAAQNDLRQAHAVQVEKLEDLQKEFDVRVGRMLELEQTIAERAAARDHLQRMYDEQSVWAEKLSKENSDLMVKFRALERHFEESSLYATSAMEENNQLRERVEVLQRKIDEITDQLAEATLSLTEMQPRIEATARGDEQMREFAVRAELFEVQAAELQAALTAKTSVAEEALRKQLETEEAMQTLQEQFRSLSLAAEERENERAELRARTAALESQKGMEEAEAAALTQEAQKLRARLYELQKQFDERSAVARNAAQENEKLKSRVTALQKSLEEKTAANSLSQEELSAVREKLTTLHHDYENKLTQAQQWERDNKKKLEHVADLQRKVDEQTLAMHEMKIDFEKQATAFDTFQKSQADVQQRYNRSQIRVQDLQQQVAILEQQLAQIQNSGLVKTLSKIGLFSKEKE
jgi:SAM-dependent methyltransferase